MKSKRGGTNDEILHDIIHHSENSLPQIAEQLGVQEYVLYEWADPAKPRRFPLALVLALTRITGDTRLIEHLAAQAGLVTFRPRKRGKSELDQVADLQEYLQYFAELLKLLIEVFRDKKKVDKRVVLKEIDRFLGTLAGIRQDVENLSEQYELELEE